MSCNINANFLRGLLDTTSMLATRQKKRKVLGEARKESKLFWKEKKVILLGHGNYSLTAISFSKYSRTVWMEIPPRHLQLFHSVACGMLIFPCLSQQAENTTRKFSRGWRLQTWYLLFQNFIPSPEGLWKRDMFLLHVDVFWEHVSFKSKRIFLISAICPAVLSIQKLVSTFEW